MRFLPIYLYCIIKYFVVCFFRSRVKEIQNWSCWKRYRCCSRLQKTRSRNWQDGSRVAEIEYRSCHRINNRTIMISWKTLKLFLSIGVGLMSWCRWQQNLQIAIQCRKHPPTTRLVKSLHWEVAIYRIVVTFLDLFDNLGWS